MMVSERLFCAQTLQHIGGLALYIYSKEKEIVRN
jgi:hypothetical protein